uniref:Uncharacterized protein n=1 Tax=viral metagenome TaxID=1070528 RepID=A0A6H1ZLV5_9ZZZZ
MWIGKKEYYEIKSRLASLERQMKGGIYVKVKGIKEPRPYNALSAYMDPSYKYIGIEKAIQLIIEHLQLEYTANKISPESLDKLSS